MTKTYIIDRATLDLDGYNRLLENASSGTIIRFQNGSKQIKIKRSSRNLRFAYAFYPEDKLTPGPLQTFRDFYAGYCKARDRKAGYMAAWVNGHEIQVRDYELELVSELGSHWVDLVDGYVAPDLNPVIA